MSELSGTSTMVAKAKELGIDTEKEAGKAILDRLKDLESEGYQFEAAEAASSFWSAACAGKAALPPGWLPHLRGRLRQQCAPRRASRWSTPTVWWSTPRPTAMGPVNALDKAVRKALERFYPELGHVRLIDYKVRVIEARRQRRLRSGCLIRSTDGE